jgi:hypothetical protein
MVMVVYRWFFVAWSVCRRKRFPRKEGIYFFYGEILGGWGAGKDLNP